MALWINDVARIESVYTGKCNMMKLTLDGRVKNEAGERVPQQAVWVSTSYTVSITACDEGDEGTLMAIIEI